MRKLLLHLCCGPCAIMPVLSLREAGFEPFGCFYNPNIHPLQEYLLRREAVLAAAEKLALPLLWPQPESQAWDLPQWLAAVPFSEKRQVRCRVCYALRLERTAFWAREQGFDAFGSSLLYSRHQAHELIREEGERAANKFGIDFLYMDFRSGWQRGIELAKEWGLYRQNYCACIYSETERHQRSWQKASAKLPSAGPEVRPVFCPPLC